MEITREAVALLVAVIAAGVGLSAWLGKVIGKKQALSQEFGRRQQQIDYLLEWKLEHEALTQARLKDFEEMRRTTENNGVQIANLTKNLDALVRNLDATNDLIRRYLLSKSAEPI